MRASKNVAIFALFLIITLSAYAAVPRLLTVQGRLKQGDVLAHGDYNIVFYIYNVSSGGTPLWQESHTNVHVDRGYFSVILGETNPINLDFKDQYWLALKVNNDPEMSPRLKLTNSSYAFYAIDANVAQATSLWTDAGTYIYPNNYSSFVITDDGKVGIGTTAPNYKLTVAGPISMYDETQSLDSRYIGTTFLRGWSSFNAGSESNITYTTDTSSPVGNEVLEVSTYVWARGPKIRLDKTKNYEVEMWVKRQTANTAGTFYFVVSEFDCSGNVISGDGTDWHYPYSTSQSNLTVGTWYNFRFIVGPYGGSKNHASNACYISVGFIVNYTTGNDVMRLTGFRIRPLPRFPNDALTITNSGNVGIGTTNPGSYMLYVVGDVKFGCPSGWVAVTDRTCIMQDEAASGTAYTWFNASDYCYDTYKARLCSWSEWYNACINGLLTNGTDDYEWIDDARYTSYVTIVGSGGCTANSYASATSSYAFRCCK